jgi:hypothetical protein
MNRLGFLVSEQDGERLTRIAAEAGIAMLSVNPQAEICPLASRCMVVDEQKLVDRAKCILMTRLQLGEPESHALLQRLASGRSEKKCVVASDIIAAEKAFLDTVTEKL